MVSKAIPLFLLMLTTLLIGCGKNAHKETEKFVMEWADKTLVFPENYDKAYVDCSSCKRIEFWKGTGTEARCMPR